MNKPFETIKRSLGMSIASQLLMACTCHAPLIVKIASIKSVGCSLLSYADTKEIFRRHGMLVEIKEYASLKTAQSAQVHGQWDVLCSSLSELLMIAEANRLDLKVILVADSSNGADVLIARKDAGNQLSDLKGARIGMEPTSMGELLLAKALALHSLSRDDFTVLAEDTDSLSEAISKSEIQLAIARPPVSWEILKNPDMAVLYQSSQMPGELLETLSATAAALHNHPNLQSRLTDIWSAAVVHARELDLESAAFLTQAAGLPNKHQSLPYTFFEGHEQAQYLSADGKLSPLIERMQNGLLLSGQLSSKRDARSFLPNP